MSEAPATKPRHTKGPWRAEFAEFGGYDVEEEEDICELMREYKDSCTKELSARCEKQVMCPHEHTRGGNDYMECVDCELEWDYRKENPPIIEARRRAEKAESEVRELRAQIEAYQHGMEELQTEGQRGGAR